MSIAQLVRLHNGEALSNSATGQSVRGHHYFLALLRTKRDKVGILTWLLQLQTHLRKWHGHKDRMAVGEAHNAVKTLGDSKANVAAHPGAGDSSTGCKVTAEDKMVEVVEANAGSGPDIDGSAERLVEEEEEEAHGVRGGASESNGPEAAPADGDGADPRSEGGEQVDVAAAAELDSSRNSPNPRVTRDTAFAAGSEIPAEHCAEAPRMFTMKLKVRGPSPAEAAAEVQHGVSRGAAASAEGSRVSSKKPAAETKKATYPKFRYWNFNGKCSVMCGNRPPTSVLQGQPNELTRITNRVVWTQYQPQPVLSGPLTELKSHSQSQPDMQTLEQPNASQPNDFLSPLKPPQRQTFIRWRDDGVPEPAQPVIQKPPPTRLQL